MNLSHLGILSLYRFRVSGASKVGLRFWRANTLLGGAGAATATLSSKGLGSHTVSALSEASLHTEKPSFQVLLLSLEIWSVLSKGIIHVGK